METFYEKALHYWKESIKWIQSLWLLLYQQYLNFVENSEYCIAAEAPMSYFFASLCTYCSHLNIQDMSAQENLLAQYTVLWKCNYITSGQELTVKTRHSVSLHSAALDFAQIMNPLRKSNLTDFCWIKCWNYVKGFAQLLIEKLYLHVLKSKGFCWLLNYFLFLPHMGSGRKGAGGDVQNLVPFLKPLPSKSTFVLNSFYLFPCKINTPSSAV